MVDSDLFDHDMDLELLELETTSNQQNNQDDGFEDDDLDLDQLVEVAETIEQQRAVSNGNISFVSTEEDSMPPPPLPENTPNFHPIHSENLRTWIYPTNYPIRGYQLNIVQKAMFNNTLVALPTGLGKTFIAAVVMFNYWRWFPNSKIIFMAPTRPLVEQQIEACFTICGLPQEETVEMTGSISPAKRRDLWQSKRVFFATPQTIQKDIETHACPIEKIACIVVDEAHKATGNYAYTEVVRKLYKKNKQFRILALTATPGGGIDTVQKVIENLHITNIQIRTEDSMDIREFSYGKNVQNIVVKLGYTEGSTGILPRIVDDYRNKVFLPILVDLSKKPINVQPDIERASPYGLRSTRMRFQAEARNFDARFKFSIIAQMLVAESASRAHDLLCQHGVVPFLESIESTLEEFKKKPKMNKAEIALCNNSALNAMIRNVKQEVVKPDFIGHPKLDRLIAILLSHFSGIPQNETSKVMIFSSYRSSVVEICKVLDRHRPMIRSSFFVGQSTDKHGTKGLRQSEQQQVSEIKYNNIQVLTLYTL
jgi:ERCC4-related helicase